MAIDLLHSCTAVGKAVSERLRCGPHRAFKSREGDGCALALVPSDTRVPVQYHRALAYRTMHAQPGCGRVRLRVLTELLRQAVRARLTANRRHAPLYDTVGWVREWEASVRCVWDLYASTGTARSAHFILSSARARAGLDAAQRESACRGTCDAEAKPARSTMGTAEPIARSGAADTATPAEAPRLQYSAVHSRPGSMVELEAIGVDF